MFKYYNPEKFKNIQNTCILRAFSLIYKEIDINSDIKQKWRNILLNDNFEYINIPAKPFRKRMTVKELACLNDPNSVIICSTADHVVCIIGNDYYDIADSGDKCVFYYFRKENYYGDIS